MIEELFKQLRSEAPTQNIVVLENNSNQYRTRWNSKDLLPSKYNRTVRKKKSIENTLQEAYNWLKCSDLIPKTVVNCAELKLKK